MKKLKVYIERNKSVITGNELEIIHTLKNFPVFFGCVDTPQKNDLVADMTWGIDPQCGCVQLTKLIPEKILYQEQHVDGTGPIWAKYYNDFAKFIIEQKSEKILEIGGGIGKLAIEAVKINPGIKWTIIEPNPILKETSQIKIIKGFFKKNNKDIPEVDTIVMSQVFEHIYNPRKFILDLADFLPVNGKIIIAYPQITYLLRKKYTNAINFEHTMLIDDFLEYLFLERNFSIIKKKIYKNHSTFYYLKKIKKKSNLKLINKYNEYKSLYWNFISYHEKLVEELNFKIKNTSKPVYLFGAHIFSTYLFNFGLDMNLAGVLDNSKIKINRRFYGTNFIVSSPSILRGLGEVNVILKAGIYNYEIKKDILKNINPNVKFW